MIFDIPFTPSENQTYTKFFSDKDWHDERDVYYALKEIGYQVKMLGLSHNINPLIETIESFNPDIVFSLCESFRNQRSLSAKVVSLLELIGIPYTGASSENLISCQNKETSKRLLSSYNILVPKHYRYKTGGPLNHSIPWPRIVKPIDLEASEGINQKSLVYNDHQCNKQAQKIIHKYNCSALIEEFIAGKEFYVGILGNQKYEVLHPIEIKFKKASSQDMKFVTWRAKWDKKYRRKWGISSHRAESIDPVVYQNLIKTSKKIYKTLNLQGYARIDLRVSNNQIYFLEANPNPAIAKADDFALGAKYNNICYIELIEKIIKLGLKRHSNFQSKIAS